MHTDGSQTWKTHLLLRKPCTGQTVGGERGSPLHRSQGDGNLGVFCFLAPEGFPMCLSYHYLLSCTRTLWAPFVSMNLFQIMRKVLHPALLTGGSLFPTRGTHPVPPSESPWDSDTDGPRTRCASCTSGCKLPEIELLRSTVNVANMY